MKAPRTKFNKVPRYDSGGGFNMYKPEKEATNPYTNSKWNSVGSGVYAGASMLDQSIPSPINVQGSDYFSNLSEKRKQTEKAVDTASSAAAMIPVYGWAVAGGMQFGKAVGKLTQDKYGIYKSKGAQVLDNVVDPVKQVQSIGNAFSHPTRSNLLNSATMGIFGKDQQDEENKRQRGIYQNRMLADTIASSDRAGNMNMNRLPTYQSPLYGRRGIQLRKHPSMNVPGRPSMRFTTKFGSK